MKKTQAHGPMTEMLQGADNTTRMHMPGHKGILDSFDTTELARTDDLYAPRRGIRDAETLAAKACGAAHTIMLTGGSTAGLLAMILSTVAPGETLILPRGAHHACVSACVWGDIAAVFADDLPNALREHPGAKALLVTRPDYYGRCADLQPLIAQAKQTGTLVLVDEAHGAHFSWWDAPQSAGTLGADAWVQSAHKTLPALTGAAWLHLPVAMDADRARRFLRMVQTSSPPFPILQSLDEARTWMDAYGREALVSLQGMLARFREKLLAVGGYADVPADDPTRLVIDTRGRGYTGLSMQAALAEHRVDVEMADDARIVCICTVADRQQDFDRLLAALRYIPQREPLGPVATPVIPPAVRRLSVRAAALSPQEAVPLAQAAGRVAAIGAGMYPPGIPLALPGEEITAAHIAFLTALPADRRFGVEDNCLICVK